MVARDGGAKREERDAVNGTLTDVRGLSVGHWTDREAATGCTVVLCDGEGAVAGVDVRGAAPGTRETDLLDLLALAYNGPLQYVEGVGGPPFARQA